MCVSFTLAVWKKASCATCAVTLPEPKLSELGLLCASWMNSASVRAGTLGCTVMM